jgi:hypothetical protein
MNTPTATPYCSTVCREKPVVRSFSRCPECGGIWNGRAGDSDRHYRNNAWKICNSCAERQNRCVVCGKDMAV